MTGTPDVPANALVGLKNANGVIDPALAVDPSAIRLEILKSTLEACHSEHDDLGDTWKVLEVKAQATVATAGLFAAAILRMQEIVGGPPQEAQAIVALCILALMGSVLLSIGALLVRPVLSTPGSKDVANLYEELKSEPDADMAGRLSGFYESRIDLWKQTCSQRRDTNQSKAAYLMFAQWCLLAGTVIAMFLSVVSIGT